MLLAGDKDEEEKASRITTSRGLALIALGISISLDELAIGFTIGLAHLPVTAVIVAIALQAFLAAQLGLAVGAKIGERWLSSSMPVRSSSGPARHSPGMRGSASSSDTAYLARGRGHRGCRGRHCWQQDRCPVQTRRRQADQLGHADGRRAALLARCPVISRGNGRADCGGPRSALGGSGRQTGGDRVHLPRRLRSHRRRGPPPGLWHRSFGDHRGRARGCRVQSLALALAAATSHRSSMWPKCQTDRATAQVRTKMPTMTNPALLMS